MKVLRNLVNLLLAVAVVLLLSACGPDFAESGNSIIDANEAAELIGQAGIVVVDTQAANFYQMEHVEGAVNISRADIVVSEPYPNLVGTKAQIEAVLGSNGISNDTTVVIYDTNKNMDSARLWWTMKAYGHPVDKIKVVSGGLSALKRAGVTVGNDTVSPASATYTAEAFDSSMMATLDDVKAQVNDPSEDTCIIDTRTIEEYREGTIPGSVHINFTNNNFKDDTYKPANQIQILYLENEIQPEDTVIMFCKTSIRGAQTHLALYNAGYRNLKLYDAAWVEWSSKPSLPVYTPEQPSMPVPTMQDGS